MKFEINKNILDKAIGKLNKVAAKHITLPVLSCILFSIDKNNLSLKATNLDLGVEINVDLKLDTKSNESLNIAVPASILTNTLSSINNKDDITLEFVEGNLKITSKKNLFTIKCLPSEDFPSIPKVTGVKTFSIDSKELQNGLKSVFYSASNSTIKPELSSVYVYKKDNYLTFVSTDSFRLAEKKIYIKNIDEFEPILIPAKNIGELIRIVDDYKGDIKVVLDTNQASFEFGSIYVVSRLIEGNFPDYNQIIPKEPTTSAVVLKNDFIEALKASGVFSDALNKVKLKIEKENKSLVIESKNNDTGEFTENIKSTVEGDDIDLSFNQKYITDSLTSILSDSLKLDFNGPGKALIISGVSDKSFLYLVMPMNR